MSDDVRTLVCATFHHYNELIRYRTSKLRMANCGHQVWMAQAGRAMLKRDPGIYVICQECAEQSYSPPDEKIESAPGAWDEIEQLEGAAFRRSAEASFRRTGGRRPW